MAAGDLPFPNFREVSVPRPNWKLIVAIFAGFVLIIALWSSAFTIEAKEVGVVLRFGAFNREVGPGLNWKLPFPIESIEKVPVRLVLKREFGFETVRADVRTQYSQRDFKDQSLMLCGDRNVAVVEWVAQYTIRSARKYLFNVRSVEDTFDDLNEAVMRAVVGDRSVTEVLTVGRTEIEDQVKEELQDLCDRYQTGILVEEIVLQDVNPPDQVKDSFNEVNEAQQERESRINQAKAERNAVIPKAKGEADRALEEAEGYAADRINRARGEVAAFRALLDSYRRAPEVTRSRLFLETMNAVYPRLKNKIVIDSELKGVLPFLDLAPLSTAQGEQR